MDKQLISRRFSRSAYTYNKRATVQRNIAKTMSYLLKCYYTKRGGRILEVGCGTGFLSRLLLEKQEPDSLLLNDICPKMEEFFRNFPKKWVTFIPGDAEQIDFPGNQNLIISCSALQWFAEPAKFFDKCASLLAPGGYLAFSTFGKRNMEEVTAITGAGLKYLTPEELTHMLSSHYEILLVKQEVIRKKFASGFHVLRLLKDTGVNAISDKPWTPGDLRHFQEEYARRFAVKGGVHLTFHPIYIIVRKKQ